MKNLRDKSIYISSPNLTKLIWLSKYHRKQSNELDASITSDSVANDIIEEYFKIHFSALEQIIQAKKDLDFQAQEIISKLEAKRGK